MLRLVYSFRVTTPGAMGIMRGEEEVEVGYDVQMVVKLAARLMMVIHVDDSDADNYHQHEDGYC